MQKRKEIHVNFAQIDEVNIPAKLQAISGEFGRREMQFQCESKFAKNRHRGQFGHKLGRTV